MLQFQLFFNDRLLDFSLRSKGNIEVEGMTLRHSLLFASIRFIRNADTTSVVKRLYSSVFRYFIKPDFFFFYWVVMISAVRNRISIFIFS